MLKYFNIDESRHQLYVDVEFYQMNLSSVVNIAKTTEPDAFIQDGIFLPSWSKFAAKPVKAKGFFTNMLQAVFEGKGGDDSLNVDFQTGRRAKEGIKVAMMFLPGSTTNENLLEIKPIAEQALRGFRIILVSGAEDITNATAENEVKEAIELAEKSNQHVLIISAGMAQRSFSIPQITELYLAYDTGDNGATIQKMSRTLTPHKQGKVGRVISLSFDPNRDDKFDAMLIETARNYNKNKQVKDMKQALKDVLKTVDIFKCQPEGAVKIEIDDYLEEAIARKSIHRVIGKVARIEKMSMEQLKALASGNIDLFRASTREAAERGKTSLSISKQKTIDKKNISKSLLEDARKMIVTIAQNIDIIRYQGGTTLDESFEILDRKPAYIRQGISEDFGVEYEMIKELVLGGIIERDLIELIFT